MQQDCSTLPSAMARSKSDYSLKCGLPLYARSSSCSISHTTASLRLNTFRPLASFAPVSFRPHQRRCKRFRPVGLRLLMSCRLTWALQNEGVPSRPGGLSHSGTSISTVLISRTICWTGGICGTGSTGGGASACWSVSGTSGRGSGCAEFRGRRRRGAGQGRNG